MFREICRFIETRTGFTTASGRLQVGHHVQTAPVRCVLISEVGGGEPNFDCPDMANLNIQAIARGESYFEAREDAWTVFNALHGTSGWNIPRIDGSGEDYLAMTIEAMTTPQYIGQDVNGYYEISTNFIFRMEQASCGG